MVIKQRGEKGKEPTDSANFLKSVFRCYANEAQDLLLSRGCKMTRTWLYLDMFDTTAYKLARLVQIPRYIKYLWGRKRKMH